MTAGTARPGLADACVALGGVLLVISAWLVTPALGLCVAGLLCILTGLLVARIYG